MKPTIDFDTLTRDLRSSLQLHRELLALTETENRLLHHPAPTNPATTHNSKKDLLPRLNHSLNRLRQHRVAWQAATQAQRSAHVEVASLLQENQDLIMKIIVLDRNNEQTLLRLGLLTPRHLPSVNQHRPHFVANLYQRQAPAPILQHHAD